MRKNLYKTLLLTAIFIGALIGIGVYLLELMISNAEVSSIAPTMEELLKGLQVSPLFIYACIGATIGGLTIFLLYFLYSAIQKFPIFQKRYRYDDYLPIEISNQLDKVSEENLERYFKNKQLNFYKITIENLSEHLCYFSISFISEEDLNVFEEYISAYKELVPIWTAFPDLMMGAPRWNQGVQEDYGIKKWLPYWNSLSEEQKQRYREKYNCPQALELWLDENKNTLK